MDSIQVCLLAIAGVTAITVIRKWNSDFLPLMRLCLAILLSAILLSLTAPLVSYVKSLTESTGLSGYAEFLFKALAIAILTQFCAELCRESGESGAANGVELAGKAELLLLCLSPLKELFALAADMLQGV